MHTNQLTMQRIFLCSLLLLWCGTLLPQELSKDFYAYQQKMVKCRDDKNSVQTDFEDVARACESIASTHPSEEARAYLLMGELYKDAVNANLRNSPLSQAYYRKACASAGPDDVFTSSKALYCQGLLYYTSRPDMMQNFDSSFYYFSQAARYDDLFLVGLGSLLQYGLGVEQDEKAALANYAAAIAGGSDCYADFYATEYTLRARANGSLNLEAYNDYCKYYVENNLNGNWTTALGFLKKSAAAEYPPAMLDLAIFYMNGKIVPDREGMIANADLVLQKAVKTGYLPAIYQYGFLQECQLTSAEDKRAKTLFNYYKRSAESGYAPGQYATGICYLNGYGTKQDLDKAGAWVTAAVNQGYKRAVDGQNKVLARIENIKQEKAIARQERLRKWAMAMEIISGVADAASQAMTTNAPPTQKHYGNSAQVMSDSPSHSYSSTPSSAASEEISRGYCPVLKIGNGFGDTWSDGKGSVEISENSRSKMKSIKIGNKYYTLSENHKNEFLGVPVSRYNFFTIIGNVYYFVAL